MRLLYPTNRKVLAYIREDKEQAILCVANLSRQAQAAEVDLSGYTGRVPVELSGESSFPPIGALPYLVTLPAYGFFWFLLADESESPSWHLPVAQPLPEFITLTTRDGRIDTAVSGREGRQLEADVLPEFLRLQRWFASKDKPIRSVSLTPLAEMEGPHALAVLDVDTGGESERYFLPLSAIWGEEAIQHGAPTLSFTISKLRRMAKVGALADGTGDPDMARALVYGLKEGTTLPANGGEVVFRASDALREMEDLGDPRRIPGEQSNASIVFGDAVVMKIYRRLREGVQPEIEMGRFLTDVAGFENTPALLGTVELRAEGDEVTTLASVFAFVRNQGDAWAYLTDALMRDLDAAALGEEDEEFPYGLVLSELLGRRTAEMHRALAIETDDPAFAAVPVTEDATAAMVGEVIGELDARLVDLETALPGLPEETASLAREVLDRRGELTERLEAMRGMAPSGMLTRIHGDYHLGQVLVAQNDVYVIDFEGEPKRPLEERRAKSHGLRDVAGMLRSLDYAATAALRDRTGSGDAERAEARAAAWLRQARRELVCSYEEAVAGSRAHPEGEFGRALLDLFLIQKAAYEVGYEMSFRPDWVGIPLRGLLVILDGDEDRPEADEAAE